MAQHARVPKFGNWDSDRNVPYTQYFDNARKGKTGGKLINPNDPIENPEAFSTDPDVPMPNDERRTSRGDDHHDVMSRQRYGDRPNAGDQQRKVGRAGGGPDRSVEHSPLHPHYQVRAASKSGVSSSWERKGPSEGNYGLGSGTPGRSRIRAGGRGDETPERGSAVPKFGAWDEKDPSSADGFTHIFNKVREEKQTGSGKAPNITNDAIYVNNSRQDDSYETSSCSCFGWCRK
ncbi:RPM1-interacting protein 4-like [Typha latifolia]|uniref:RPM1-interacting protein 4-like n=1 Tax=Typha latifolia TaxID=4733 RepID=UPI003C2D7496